MINLNPDNVTWWVLLLGFGLAGYFAFEDEIKRLLHWVMEKIYDA